MHHSAFTAGLTFLLILTAVPPRHALPLKAKKDWASQVRRQNAATQQTLQIAVAEYKKTPDELDMLTSKTAEMRQRLAQMEAKLQRSEQLLSHKVVRIHKTGGLRLAEVLLGAKDLDGLLLRLSLLKRVAQQDADAAAEAAELKRKLATQRSALEEAEKRQLNLLKRLSRLRIQDKAPKRIVASRGGRRVFGIGGFVFPVARPRSYANSWGAPRPGGRRHKGVDIFATKGTPVVAAVSGTIQNARPHPRGLGGITLWLRGTDGNRYFYAHLASIAVSNGDRVTAGHIVGYVGNTGNARGSSPHLHFEILLRGGPVNPYPILRAADG